MNDYEGLIKNEVPPNWADVHEHFNVTEQSKVLYAYAPHVYNPSKTEVPFMLVAHEKVHLEQQTAYDGGVVEWWSRYINDMRFRLGQELQAHRAEYKAVCDQPECNRMMRRGVLRHISKKLASPLYGCLLPAKVAYALLPACDDDDVVQSIINCEYPNEAF